MHHPTDMITHTNGLCYISRGALAGTRNSSMGPPHEGSIWRPIAPWANALPLSYVPLPETNKIGYSFADFINSNKPNNILFGRLPNKLSIYTAEINAIIGAMAWISNNKITKSVIFSDSLSSKCYYIHTIIKTRSTIYLVMKLQTTLQKKSLEYSDQHICNDIPYGINKIMSIAKKTLNHWMAN